jgi:hypothetical protein
MNLLCPNCQKMLTVPEQYAGQLMKCPLCNGTFTVPALPAAPTAPPPPTPGPEIFNFKEPIPPNPPTSAAPSLPPPVTQPSAPPVPPPPPPPLPPGEYARKASIWFSPKVLQFVPGVAIVLIFILQLVPWVGVYAGSYAIATQNAWGTAFGPMFGVYPAEENDLKGLFRFTREDELKKAKDQKEEISDNRPTTSWLMIFYLLGFFFTGAITIVCVALPFLPLKLPPAVLVLLKWKWALALVFNLLLFFCLLLQLLVGFGMENGIKSAAAAELARRNKALEADKKEPIPKLQQEAVVSVASNVVQHTTWLNLVIILHVLIIFTALLMFWLDQRETFNKPLPELTLRW